VRPFLILLAALLPAAGLVLVLRTRARRRRWAKAVAAEFERFVASLAGWTAEGDAGEWRLHHEGRPVGRLLRTEVLAAAARSDRRGAGRRADAWAARLCFLTSPLVPLAGPLSLKLHGSRLLPRPSHPETLVALSRQAPPAVGRSAELACPLLYVVAETEPTAYVPEAAVREAGIDVPALHGVAVAVLRQRLDPTPVARALAGDEVVEVRPADGCGAARVALLPELLAPGERLTAVALDPATLLLASPAASGRLEARLAAARLAPREALLDRVLDVGPDGVEESGP
jgi:hypothetical protein